MLEYCWQCGSQLNAFSNAGQFYQGAPPTQQYSLPNQPQMFNGSGQNYGQNFQPNFQPRAASYSAGRVAAVLGGFFLFLVVIAGAGAAVVYRVANQPKVNRYSEYRYRQQPPPKSPAVRENPADVKRRSGKQSAELEKIWVDYNVRENGRLGMRIHARFSVFNMKNVDSRLTIYFEKPDGTRLAGSNPNFSSKDGKVAASRTLKPGWDDTVYKDLEVFMPYDELNLGKGKHDLKMNANVTLENGELVEHLGYHEFLYEKK